MKTVLTTIAIAVVARQAAATNSVDVGVAYRVSPASALTEAVLNVANAAPAAVQNEETIFSGTESAEAVAVAPGIHIDNSAIAPSERSYTWHKTSETRKVRTNAAAWSFVYEKLLHQNMTTNLQSTKNALEIAEPTVQIAGDLDKIETETETAPSGQPITGEALKPSPSWMSVWPHGSTAGWHLDADRTQLSDAYNVIEQLRQSQGGDFKPARIAIIDTYFDYNNPSLASIHVVAKHTVKDSTGVGGGPSHGTGTMSILAGGPVDVKGPSPGQSWTVHGANPGADIIAIDGAKGVAQVFSNMSIVDGLRLAVEEKAEIVSLSNGGWPSELERNAINHAYDHGIAVFAASGNNYALPIVGPSTPSFVAFPAAYSTCACVVGVTAGGYSYARAPSWWGFLFSWSDWIFRGNCGPIWDMDRAVSGYSPNIAWALKDSTTGIRLNGAGTSAAVPQAAGAASLWLEYNRKDVDRIVGTEKKDQWKRAELVSQAIFRSAILPRQRTAGAPVDAEFGHGVVKALDAIKNVPASETLLSGGKMHAKESPDVIFLILSILYPRLPAGSPLDFSGAPAKRSIHGILNNSVSTVFSQPSQPKGNVQLFALSDRGTGYAIRRSVSHEAEQAFYRSKKWAGYVSHHYGKEDYTFLAEYSGEEQKARAKSALDYLLSDKSDTSPQLKSVVRGAREAAETAP